MADGISVDKILKDLEWLNATADELDGRLKESINKPIRAMIMTLRDLTNLISKGESVDEQDIETLKKLGINIAARFDKKRLAFSIDEYERKTKITPDTDPDIEKNFQSSE